MIDDNDVDSEFERECQEYEKVQEEKFKIHLKKINRLNKIRCIKEVGILIVLNIILWGIVIYPINHSGNEKPACCECR